MTRAALYLRQSKDRTGEELAVERQRDDALKLAQMRGWEVVRSEVDNDTSAAGRRARPGFEAILTAIESSEVDAVIAWDMTRLTRNRRDTVRVIETGERHKTRLAFVKGADLDLATSGGRMVADIFASVAREEIEQKSERQKGAALQAARNGVPHRSRIRAFGYEADGMIIRKSEAQALRAAYAALLAGRTLVGLCRDLTAAGFTTTAGKPWRHSGIRSILLNPRNAGLRSYTETSNGRTIEGKEREIIGPAKWDAIIDEDTFYAAQALLVDPARRMNQNTGTARRWLLGGLALCGRCNDGTTVRVNYRERDAAGVPVRVYRCRKSGHLTRVADWCDWRVNERVIARLSQPDARDLLVDDNRENVADLRRERSAVKMRLDQLGEDFADGTIARETLRSGTERARARLADLDARMAHAGQAPLLDDLVNAENVRAKWEAVGLDRQRAVIDLLYRVTLLPRPGGRAPVSLDSVIMAPKV